MKILMHDQPNCNSGSPNRPGQNAGKLVANASLLLIMLPTSFGFAQATGSQSATSDEPAASIEEKTRVHRLNSPKRTTYDAFVYLNRIPEKTQNGETAEDLTGRVFGRLANQEGRILLKLPPGMDRQSYTGFKAFMRSDGTSSVGNCAACHTPDEFTDEKVHVVSKHGEAKLTPSLRNLELQPADYRRIVQEKVANGRSRQSGNAPEIDEAYGAINLTEQDITQITAFMLLLQDVSDEAFRELVLKAELLNTSIELQLPSGDAN